MKKRVYQLLRIMKISLVLFILAIEFAGMAYAVDSHAQEMLNRPVSINVREVLMTKALRKLSLETGVKFLYNSKVVQPDWKVSIQATNEPLSEVLDRVLARFQLTYEVSGSQLILRPLTVEESKRGLHAATVAVNLVDQVVTGTVSDDKGELLPGVSIVLKGTTSGTTTNDKGQFRLSVPNEKAILTFSFIGYVSQEVTVGNQSALTIQLVSDNKTLSEIVVVGYGEQKKATVTGSVASITNKELKTTTNGNVTNMLAGKLPGLRVTQRNSEPGSYASDFDIRGLGSPLVIIDGVQRDNFNRLDPNEIESVSILKDASAAVYGVRAANGVVLITTKRGKEGTVDLTYSGTYGFSGISNTPKVMNAYEFATLTNEADYNSGKTTPTFSQNALQQFRDGTVPSTNWQDLVVRKAAPIMQHNLSASGGSDKVRYFLSLGYYNEQGIWKSGDLNYNRYNLRANVNAKITKDLEAEFLINGILDNKNEPGEPSWMVFKSVWMQKPTIPVYANNNPAYLSSVADATHPLAITDASISGYTRNTTRTFQGTFALNYTLPFVTGLRARLMYSYDDKYLFAKSWKKKYGLYDYDAAANTYIPTFAHNPSSLTETYDQVALSTLQASLTYERTFAQKHNVRALVLFEQIKQNLDNFNAARQFSLDAVDQLYAGNSANQTVGSSATSPSFGTLSPIYNRASQGLVGRLNYDYAGKYLVEGSFRYDGSSLFPANHRWGFFPGVSVGWRIGDETFFKDNVRFVNNLKLRASIGKLGDDRASAYQFLSGYTYPSGSYSQFGNTLTSGLSYASTANPNLTWYSSITSDLGLDADLLNSKIHVEFDVFQRQRTGLLGTRVLSLPGTVGASLPQENLNSDLTRGLEMLLTHRNKIGSLSYNLSGNVSVTRTKNQYVERAPSNNSYRNWRDNNSNRWSDELWGYSVVGQFQSQNDINTSPIQDGQGNRTQLPGDLKYEDYNHDGIIDDNDIHPIARNSSTPGVNFGLTVGAQWNGFDLNLLFQGASRFNVQYQEQLQAPLSWGRNGLAMFMDRWHKDDPANPDSPWIAGKYPTTRPSGSFPLNYVTSTFWLNDASYLRLKSVEIGYTLPKSFLGTKSLKGVRIYANGFNLLTWTKLKFVDPEHTNGTYGYQYPITRNYNVGVNITF